MSWLEDPGAELFRGLHLGALSMDQAYLLASSGVADPLWLYSLSEDCRKCPYSLVGDLRPGANYTVSTRRWATWRLARFSGSPPQRLPAGNTSRVVCELTPDVREFGVYELEATSSADHRSNITCTLRTARDPVNIYYPLLAWMLALAALWALSCLLSRVCRRLSRRRHAVIVPTSVELAGETPHKTQQLQSGQRQRLKSLDTFRGIAIVLMIFVNSGGGGYWFFSHATWDGLHVADLVFPWFMWIMGVCIPISIRSQLRKKIPRLKMLWGILRRSSLLFLLGLCVNTVDGASLEHIRLFGVLQRFGLCYLVVASLSTLLTRRSYDQAKVSWLAPLQDVLVLSPQWLLVLGLAAAHCYLVFFLPVPGCPSGYLGPGGDHEDGLHRGCVGGATGYVDRLVLGRSHVYQRPTAAQVYGSGPFDPEGLTACLPSLLQVFLGAQAGSVLGFHRGWKARVLRWLGWGCLAGLAGAVLCLAGREDAWVPVNKNLWSMSFVMVTSCFAFFLLSACYYVIDVRQWWSGAPFYYPGMNALVMYVGHEVCYRVFPWHWSVGAMNTHALALSQDVWATLGWVLVAYWLFSANVFVSL
ncbi:heparan-alpha-glucosaminide N-acetyltransferase [Bacillus rossius redtenbacheri]|uniref:heparan-alpha-glucosaminide N-acetyltransferase n=1 Tax=Bacillus rossius redtenbacheri TaxID=93214 RepID=UPI002FDE0607